MDVLVPRGALVLPQGAFGEAGRGARVIYGQTDSLFILFPHATQAQAIALGKLVKAKTFLTNLETPL